VGARAAVAMAEAAGPVDARDRARSAHEAVLLLATEGRRPTLVAAEALGARPRAALRALVRAGAPERVVVLWDDARPGDARVARAVERLGVARASCVAEALEAAAEEEPRAERPPRRAPARRPAPPAAEPAADDAVPAARAGLPRADEARRRRRRRRDEARFVDGCFRRLDRPDELCRYVLRGLERSTGARRLSLLLLDGARTGLFVKAAKGLEPSVVGRLRAPLGSGLAGRAASLGRALSGRASAGGPRGYAGTAYVVLPLGRGEACEGVVALTDLPGDRLPDDRALAGLVRMTDRAGRAVSAARRLAQAETLSATDELTGLPNRRSFERAVHREIERARRTGSHVAVGLLDVDHFKSFNDRFGHPVGDRVLVQVARRLASAFRETDLVCRWGGEEFAVLLTGLVDGTPAEALAVLERARHAVGEKPLALGPGLPCPMVSVSGGVAVFPADGGDGPELVRRADAALYEAKRAGRDRVLHGLPA
jgi:diguanylate cyclase (GGDEF)-like protein